MRDIKTFVLLISLLLAALSVDAQSPINTDTKNQIEIINRKLSQAYNEENIALIVSYYNVHGTCMPEYNRALYNRNDISDYFRQWFAATKSNSYYRTIYEIEIFKNYVIETGIFRNGIVKNSNDSLLYKGKYIRFWKVDKDQNFTILSDIWGADDYLDRSQLPTIESAASDIIPKYKANEKLIKEVEARNQLITELVKNRQGEQHATLFTEDAIYMPYYKPMLLGLDSIKSYFVEHEKVGDIHIDSLQINASKIIGVENFVLEQGYYRVQWRSNDNNTGVVTGKSINLWKRNDKGILMLYRQMVNHD
jgi:ketosteroid isomerase-like protein